MLSASDAAINIVHCLLCHRQGWDTEEFCKKAIQSLVKKLQTKPNELDSLITAITTANPDTICVTIQRTNDGRLQISGRKNFPHVTYAKIWRWPHIRRKELKEREICKYGFNMKKDLVCVNPYHYERVVSSIMEFADLQLTDIPRRVTVTESMLGSSLKSFENPILHNTLSSTTSLTGGTSITRSCGNLSSLPKFASTSSASGGKISSKFSYLPRSAPILSSICRVESSYVSESAPTSSATRIENFDRFTKLSEFESTSGTSIIESLAKFSHSSEILSSSSGSSSESLVSFSQAVDSGLEPMPGPSNYAKSTQWIPVNPICSASISPPSSHSTSPEVGVDLLSNWVDSKPGGYVSHQPLPKYWCSVAYYELDTQVGDTFNVLSAFRTVTVDGYMNLSTAGDRFCLGPLSNFHRCDQSEKARLHIGKGVQLDLEGEGNVWLTCLSDYPVFVQSYYLDRGVNRGPGDAVHKIFSGTNVKVFDVRQCYHHIQQQATAERAAGFAKAAVISGYIASKYDYVNTSLSIDDLRKECIIRLSFVKGWGPDYQRSSIKMTPCWIEVRFHRALQILDEILQSAPINDA